MSNDSTSARAPEGRIKFRPHRGQLADAMAEMVEVDGMVGLMAHLRSIHPSYGPAFDPGGVLVSPYHGADARIGWKNTHIVHEDGWGPVGFCEMPEPAPATPPRDETPPTPREIRTVPPTTRELPSQPELGVGVAGELPGVGEYEGAQSLTSVFAFAKRECYSDEEEIVDVAERYVAGLRLRAEAAERQLAATLSSQRTL